MRVKSARSIRKGASSGQTAASLVENHARKPPSSALIANHASKPALFEVPNSLFPRFDRTESFTDIFDKFGWVAGVGGEVKLFGSNVIGRLEYLHYDFGPVLGSRSLPNFLEIRSGRQTIDVVRVGLSYKFGPNYGPSYY